MRGRVLITPRGSKYQNMEALYASHILTPTMAFGTSYYEYSWELQSTLRIALRMDIRFHLSTHIYVCICIYI